MLIKFNDLNELLAFNVKYYRYKKNISQEKLSELCSLSPRYMSDVDSGKHCPTLKKLALISKSLDVEPYMLLQNNDRDEEIVSKMNSSRQYNQKGNDIQKIDYI